MSGSASHLHLSVAKSEEYSVSASQAYGLAGRWKDALALLTRAADAGVFPDERLYCSIINAMGESGAWEQAVELLQSMRRSLSSSRGVSVNGRDDAEGGGSSEAPGNEEARTSLELLGRPVFGCACRACARQGKWQTILDLISDMREDGVPRDVAVYASAMRAFVKDGMWQRAVEIVTVEVRNADIL